MQKNAGSVFYKGIAYLITAGMEDLYSNPEVKAKKEEYDNILIGLAKKTGDPILARLKDSISGQ